MKLIDFYIDETLNQGGSMTLSMYDSMRGTALKWYNEVDSRFKADDFNIDFLVIKIKDEPLLSKGKLLLTVLPEHDNSLLDLIAKAVAQDKPQPLLKLIENFPEIFTLDMFRKSNSKLADQEILGSGGFGRVKKAFTQEGGVLKCKVSYGSEAIKDEKEQKIAKRLGELKGVVERYYKSLKRHGDTLIKAKVYKLFSLTEGFITVWHSSLLSLGSLTNRY